MCSQLLWRFSEPSSHPLLSYHFSHFPRPVPPRSLATAVLTIVPVKKGSVELVVKFSSNQLSHITGDVDVDIVA